MKPGGGTLGSDLRNRGAAAEGMPVRPRAAACRGIGGDGLVITESPASVGALPVKCGRRFPRSTDDPRNIAHDGQGWCGVLLRLSGIPQD